MAITVRGKNIEITPALNDYVSKRIGKVTKYFDVLGEITAVLTVEKGRHIVEVTVPVNGILLRGEESTTDMYTSIDLVIEKLERQIEKYRTRLSRRMREGSFRTELIPTTAVEEEIRVVKTKRSSNQRQRSKPGEISPGFCFVKKTGTAGSCCREGRKGKEQFHGGHGGYTEATEGERVLNKYEKPLCVPLRPSVSSVEKYPLRGPSSSGGASVFSLISVFDFTGRLC